ncbi:MAG: FtsQ-type POTRA domain-containing protein [Chloroflexota bacterium]
MSDRPTRAELVRRRRVRQAARDDGQTSLQATRPLPPVTTRNAGADAVVPLARKPKPKTTRRYEAALAAPRTRLHAPALPEIRFGWRWVSFFLVLLLGTALYLAWTLPMFRVNGLQMKDNLYMSADELNAALGLNNRPIFTVIPSEAEAILRMNFPELKTVAVQVSLPNVVTVTVTERLPLIRWEQGGSYTWVDDEGVAFRPRGEVQGLISVTALGAPPPGQRSAQDALAPIPFLSADIVQSARALAPFVPPGSTLMYDPKYGLGWSDPRGWQIYFGTKAADVNMKITVYLALADSLTQRGIAPVFIDMRYPNAPYYRLGQ